MCSVVKAESIYYFTGPGCPACHIFEKRILKDTEVNKLLLKFDAAFKVDTLLHQNITLYYGVKYLPYLIIVKREEHYTENNDGTIDRTSYVKKVGSWPIQDILLTDKQEFIKFLKNHLKNQEQNQKQNAADIIRKF